MAQTYFYDQQIRRWLVQFMRIFGGFSVKMGKDENGADFFHLVPVRYGDTSRMASHIIKENSENKINMLSPIVNNPVLKSTKQMTSTFYLN